MKYNKKYKILIMELDEESQEETEVLSYTCNGNWNNEICKSDLDTINKRLHVDVPDSVIYSAILKRIDHLT